MSKLVSRRVPLGPPSRPRSMGPLVPVAAWFGIVAGLIEGLGLLLFQSINWARWGPMLHVSEQIVWISVIVDLGFFVVLAILIGTVGRLIPRLPALRVTIFVLSTATVYDWLTVTGRLYHGSSLLLAIGVAAVFTRWCAKREAEALQIGKRTIPWMAAMALLAAIGIQGGRWWKEHKAVAQLPAAPPGAPNVLVIVVDTLRADHLSSYGYPRPTSPNIDRLAQEGVLFENAFSTCSWSFPSHVSLVTGRYQFEHGMGNVPRIPLYGGGPSFSGYPTLGEAFEQRGYRTAAFSANRTYFSRDLGFGRGFAHFEDYFHSPADMFVRTLYGREFSRIYLSRSDKSKPKRLLRWLGMDSMLDPDEEGSGSYGGAEGVRKRATVVNRELLNWIDGASQPRPFFAFLNYFDVHGPYGGPRSYPKPAWPQDTAVDKYDDSVRYVDDVIGSLRTEFEKRGLAGNTLLVITSDHGEALGQHELSSHGNALYRELIDVPLIFWYPGHIPAGVKVAVPVTNAALAATLMDVLGANTNFPGPSLGALWKGSEPISEWPSPLSELAENKYPGKQDRSAESLVPMAVAGPMKSLMTPQWHLIVHKRLGVQLYDWAHDPGEMNNLIYTPAGVAAARTLFVQMEDVLTRTAPSSRTSLIRAAMPLGDKTVAEPVRDRATQPVNHFYHLTALAGDRVTVEIRHNLHPPTGLDPVLTIEGGDGELLQSCRNPGDDHIPPPGISDPTPDAFDDGCISDDIGPVNRDSRLELLVPGAAGSSVEVYVRVSDWDGRGGTNMSYNIAVTGLNQVPAMRALVR